MVHTLHLYTASSDTVAKNQLAREARALCGKHITWHLWQGSGWTGFWWLSLPEESSVTHPRHFPPPPPNPSIPGNIYFSESHECRWWKIYEKDGEQTQITRRWWLSEAGVLTGRTAEAGAGELTPLLWSSPPDEFKMLRNLLNCETAHKIALPKREGQNHDEAKQALKSPRRGILSYLQCLICLNWTYSCVTCVVKFSP